MTDVRETINTLDAIYNDHFSKMPSNVLPGPAPVHNPQHDTIANALTRVQTLFATKNAEYAGQHDILGNFRRLASQQDVPMSTAWMFLAGKHIDSIQEYVKDCRANVRRDRTQSIAERIDDLIVYSLLLHVIAEEEQA